MFPHRADLLGNGGIVIELQHSPIGPDEIEQREEFYGDMLWLFDATNRFSLVPSGDWAFFSLGRTQHITHCKKPLFLDFGREIVEVESFSKYLAGISGFGRRRDRMWFINQFLSDSLAGSIPIAPPSPPSYSPIDRWTGKYPYEHMRHPTKWINPSTGDEFLLPEGTPYLSLQYEWVRRRTGERRPAWSYIIEEHPPLAAGWEPQDFSEMKTFLQGKAIILNGRLTLIPTAAQDLRVELPLNSVETRLSQADDHIRAGRLPILKTQTKQVLIQRARQYEIRTFGHLLTTERPSPGKVESQNRLSFE
jgi:hypothetical protein